MVFLFYWCFVHSCFDSRYSTLLDLYKNDFFFTGWKNCPCSEKFIDDFSAIDKTRWCEFEPYFQIKKNLAGRLSQYLKRSLHSETAEELSTLHISMWMAAIMPDLFVTFKAAIFKHQDWHFQHVSRGKVLRWNMIHSCIMQLF